jgi:hypothetical protein
VQDYGISSVRFTVNIPEKNESLVLDLPKLSGEIDSAKVVKKKIQFILVLMKSGSAKSQYPLICTFPH